MRASLRLTAMGPIQLFGDQGAEENDNQTTPITLATSAAWWNDGANTLRFVHTSTRGYGIVSASVSFRPSLSPAKNSTASAESRARYGDSREAVSRTVYEDGEDGTTVGWVQYHKGSVVNCADGANGSGRAIEIRGNIESDVFRLAKEDGSDWNNTNEFHTKFSVAFQQRQRGALYFELETTAGIKYLVYTATPISDFHFPSSDLFLFDLGDIADGLWYTIQRDLEKDFAIGFPETQIKLKAVKGLSVYGGLKLDDVILFGDEINIFNLISF